MLDRGGEGVVSDVYERVLVLDRGHFREWLCVRYVSM